MSARAVLRIEKQKSWGSIAGAEAHNFRRRETPNADPSRRQRNRILIGEANIKLADATRALIGEQTIRKNAVLAVEVLLSASPEYFQPSQSGNAHTWMESRLNPWVNASRDWLIENFGTNILSAVLHLDEKTPHIHCIFVPLDNKGKLNCRAILGGTRQTMRDYQTSYAGALKHLGIVRGIEGSKAKHTTISEYYDRITDKLVHLPKVTTPPPKLPKAPEKPGIFAGKEQRELHQQQSQQYAKSLIETEVQRKQHQNEVKARQEAITEMSENHCAMANELTAQRAAVEQLKRENSKLLQERQMLKKQIELIQGPSIANVLSKKYGVRQIKSNNNNSTRQEFGFNNCAESIYVTGDQWEYRNTKVTGYGSFSLIQYLENNCGHNSHEGTIGHLKEYFSITQIAAMLGQYISSQSQDAIRNLLKQPPLNPFSYESSWNDVREFLTTILKLPSDLVSWAYEQKIIWADAFSNCVFRRDISGHFKQSISSAQKDNFFQAVGDGPFRLPGSPETVLITQHPFDALAIKSVYPNATVLAHGKNTAIADFSDYILNSKKSMLMIPDTDTGNKLADDFALVGLVLQGRPLKRVIPMNMAENCKNFCQVLRAKPHLSKFRINKNGQLMLPSDDINYGGTGFH